MTKATTYSEKEINSITTALESVKNYAEQSNAIAKVAKALGKTIPAIRAKASNLGVYAFKKDATSVVKPKTTKAQVVVKIAATLEQDAEKLENLEKADRKALDLVLLGALSLNAVVQELTTQIMELTDEEPQNVVGCSAMDTAIEARHDTQDIREDGGTAQA